MRHKVSHRWLHAGVCVLLVGLLGWPPPSSAQLLGGTTTVLGDTGMLTAGTVDAVDSSADSASIPSLLTAEAPDAAVIGYVDQIDSTSSLTSLDVTIGGVEITADSVSAEALGSLTGGAGSANSYISNLSINGVTVPVGGSANQVIAFPGGQLVINEQQVLSDGTIVVNALDATIDGGAEVVVASATAGPSGGDANAVEATTP